MFSKKWTKVILTLLVLGFLFTGPVSVAQGPSAVSVFSIWVRLSIRGYSQEEIESVLSNMDRKTVEEVKSRLRRTVLVNLELKKIKNQLRQSRDSDDLRSIRASVETEIRFAGMQSDPLLRLMIKDRFGVRLEQL